MSPKRGKIEIGDNLMITIVVLIVMLALTIMVYLDLKK